MFSIYEQISKIKKYIFGIKFTVLNICMILQALNTPARIKYKVFVVVYMYTMPRTGAHTI